MGPFAILVQLALGALALLSLVYKRWRERPQRPIKVWFFDASKQVFGSVLVHGANVFMSLLTSGKVTFTVAGAPMGASGGDTRGQMAVRTVEAVAVVAAARMRRAMELGWGQMVVRRIVARVAGADEGSGEDGDEYVPNPCSLYLLNLGIDTTLGIPILILILRIITRLVALTPLGNPPESIQSGNYGTPPNAWWWFKQSIIYFCGLMGMKICVLILFMLLPWLPRVGDWALGWTEGNEKLQIVFVMMLFPVIMNALQYYIIDSFIKKKITANEADAAIVGDGSSRAGASHRHHRRRRDGHSNVAYEELAAASSDEIDDSSDSYCDMNDDDEPDDAQKHHQRRYRRNGQHHRKSSRKTSSSHLLLKKTRTRSSSSSGGSSSITTVTPCLNDTNTNSNGPVEYDPAVDGDSHTVIGSGRSHDVQSRDTFPKELLNAE